jgi:D-alanyl-D-alanine carboxypeptidase, serine-type, PBP4 family
LRIIKKFKITLLIFFIFSNAKAGNIYEEKIDSIFSTIGGNVSCIVMSTEHGDVIYSLNPGMEMIPASVTKLVTSIVAMDVLGPDYKFKTVVYSDANVTGGVVNGNLYLKGFGDPDLYSGDISTLAKEVAKTVRQVNGNIIYDNSFLDDNYYALADYYSGDTKKQYWPYVAGINIDKNNMGGDPGFYAADLLTSELTVNGVTISGEVVSGVTPPRAVQIAEFSHSLKDVLIQMNKASDNLSAISVFKVIGAVNESPPGTLQKGTNAVIDYMTRKGVDRNEYEILEGSGLTRYNIVTGNLFMRLLKIMYDDLKNFDMFYNSLPIAGYDGTLRKRMIGTEAERNVRAKTGSLNSVSALAGYTVSRDNELLMFYIVNNGFSGGWQHARDVQDAVCEVISSFTRKNQ